MNKRVLYAVILLAVVSQVYAEPSVEDTYGTLVDEFGNISVPQRLRTEWVFLGTWSVADEDVQDSSEASGHGVAGLHNVYTQPDAIEGYLETGEFPDGTVIVKELLVGTTQPMTTGTVSHGTEVEGWFIMVKDTQGRFNNHALWGDGWGWVLYSDEDTSEPVTRSYTSECLGCHLPAKDSDWVYVEGYPVLLD
jgi:hypothetical protein